MRIPPVSVYLTWPKPNYTDPNTRGPALMVVNAFFLGLTTLAVALRLYTKIFVKKSFGWDDGLIIISFIFTVGINTTLDIGVSRYGMNRHTWDIPLDWIESLLKIAYSSSICFLISGIATSLSLLAFYYRLNRTAQVKWFKWLLHIATVEVIVTWLPFTCMVVFPCSPIHADWDFPPPAHSKCLNGRIAAFGGGLFKVINDFLLTTIPIPLVLRLKMSKRERYAVTCLLGLGYVVTAAGAVRLYYTYVVFWKTYDLVWYQYPGTLAAVIENDLGVICACVPMLRPLFRKFLRGSIKSLVMSPFRSKASKTGSSNSRSTLSNKNSARSGVKEVSTGSTTIQSGYSGLMMHPRNPDPITKDDIAEVASDGEEDENGHLRTTTSSILVIQRHSDEEDPREREEIEMNAERYEREDPDAITVPRPAHLEYSTGSRWYPNHWRPPSGW